VRVIDGNSGQRVYFNNLRMFEGSRGCLPECLRIEEDALGFHFNGDKSRYSLVNSFDVNGPNLYCRESESGFTSVGMAKGSSLATGFPKGVTDKNIDIKNLPTCLYIEKTGGGSGAVWDQEDGKWIAKKEDANQKWVPDKGTDTKIYDNTYTISVQPNSRKFEFSTKNLFGQNNQNKKTKVGRKHIAEAKALAKAGYHCLYHTVQPRCIDFYGLLDGAKRSMLTCEDHEPEPMCISTAIDALCPLDSKKPCGERKQTRDILACCDKNGNKAGTGCTANSAGRRRLGASKRSIIFRVGQTLDAAKAESCARKCMEQADEKPCVAWRLEAGMCRISFKCVHPKSAYASKNNLRENVWTLVNDDPFQGRRKTKVRRKKL